MRLLLVEDKEIVSRLIVKSLSAERFAGDVAADGSTGLEAALGVGNAIYDEGGA
jgi:DNA-binding response OmpR family regulator